MTCKCGENPFVYNFYKQDGIYEIKKCNRLKIDGIKKSPCDYFEENLINKRYITNSKVISKEEDLIIKKDYKKELYRFIHMYENFKPNENYMNNIIYLLFVCGYKYIHGETITELKKRLDNFPDKKINYDSIYPVTLIDIPKHLKPTKNNTKNKTKKSNKKLKFTYVILSDEESENESCSEDCSDREEYEINVDDNLSDEEVVDDNIEGYLSD